MGPILRGDKDSVLRAYPIFGGTAPTETQPTEETKTDGGEAGKSTQTTQSAGGETQTEDPASQFANDPKAINQLLKQVSDLQKNLEGVTKQKDAYEQEKLKAERAQQTREQQLETDLQNSQEVIEKMDRVVRTMAIQNAFLSSGDYQWNSVRQAMSELEEGNYDVNIDLDGGKAEVSGIENEVKRIAQACPWLLKSTSGTTTNNGSSGGRGSAKPASGTPPAPPRGNEGQQVKRADMMKRFPAIARR